jgi:hypothetical protein
MLSDFFPQSVGAEVSPALPDPCKSPRQLGHESANARLENNSATSERDEMKRSFSILLLNHDQARFDERTIA